MKRIINEWKEPMSLDVIGILLGAMLIRLGYLYLYVLLQG